MGTEHDDDDWIEVKTSSGMEHKIVPVMGQKVLDDEHGVVETIVSVTGIVDRVKDVIEPGAYEKTLRARTPKGVWHHDWTTPVSRTESIEELMPGDPRLPKELKDGSPWPKEAGALLVKTRFNLETQRGRDAYSDVKFFGDEQEWSIGYQVPPGGSRVERKSGNRHISYMDLFEYSPVLFGAMPEAVTQSVKSAQAALAALRESGAVPEAGVQPPAEPTQDSPAAAGEREAVPGEPLPEVDPSSYAPGAEELPALNDEQLTELFLAARDEIEAELTEMDEAVERWADAGASREKADAVAVLLLELKRQGGNAETLRRYWSVGGEGGGKIRWGTDGDHTRCVRYISKYMPRSQAHGYCNLMSKRNTGLYSGDARSKDVYGGVVTRAGRLLGQHGLSEPLECPDCRGAIVDGACTDCGWKLEDVAEKAAAKADRLAALSAMDRVLQALQAGREPDPSDMDAAGAALEALRPDGEEEQAAPDLEEKPAEPVEQELEGTAVGGEKSVDITGLVMLKEYLDFVAEEKGWMERQPHGGWIWQGSPLNSTQHAAQVRRAVETGSQRLAEAATNLETAFGGGVKRPAPASSSRPVDVRPSSGRSSADAAATGDPKATRAALRAEHPDWDTRRVATVASSMVERAKSPTATSDSMQKRRTGSGGGDVSTMSNAELHKLFDDDDATRRGAVRAELERRTGEWNRNPGIKIPPKVAEHFGGGRFQASDLELVNPDDPDRPDTELPDDVPSTAKWVAVWGDEVGLWDPESNRVWAVQVPEGGIVEQSLGGTDSKPSGAVAVATAVAESMLALGKISAPDSERAAFNEVLADLRAGRYKRGVEQANQLADRFEDQNFHREADVLRDAAENIHNARLDQSDPSASDLARVEQAMTGSRRASDIQLGVVDDLDAMKEFISDRGELDDISAAERALREGDSERALPILQSLSESLNRRGDLHHLQIVDAISRLRYDITDTQNSQRDRQRLRSLFAGEVEGPASEAMRTEAPGAGPDRLPDGLPDEVMGTAQWVTAGGSDRVGVYDPASGRAWVYSEPSDRLGRELTNPAPDEPARDELLAGPSRATGVTGRDNGPERPEDYDNTGKIAGGATARVGDRVRVYGRSFEGVAKIEEFGQDGLGHPTVTVRSGNQTYVMRAQDVSPMRRGPGGKSVDGQDLERKARLNRALEYLLGG